MTRLNIKIRCEGVLKDKWLGVIAGRSATDFGGRLELQIPLGAAHVSRVLGRPEAAILLTAIDHAFPGLGETRKEVL